MAVVLGEDDGLWDVLAPGEYLGAHLVAKGLYHRADLVDGHHVTVQLVRLVLQVVLKLLPALVPRHPVTLVDPRPGLHGAALFGDLRADAVDVEVDVYVVGHRLLVVVLHYEVLVEEAEGLLGRRRRQPNQEPVKVLQHLPPQIVNGAMALVRDDDVEGLDGELGVVLNRRHLPLQRIVESRQLLHLGVKFFALEDGIDPLDGRDANAAHRIDAARLQKLDIVELGKLALLIGCREALEFAKGLAPQIAAVH